MNSYEFDDDSYEDVAVLDDTIDDDIDDFDAADALDDDWSDEDEFDMDDYDSDDWDDEIDDEADTHDVDSLLDGMVADSEEDDLSERRRRRRSRRSRALHRRRAALRRRARARSRRRRAAASRRTRSSRGRSSYKAPIIRKSVNQGQLKGSLDMVSKQIKRNAAGIRTNVKSIGVVRKKVDRANGRVDALKGRVDSVVRVNREQHKRISQNKKVLKIDGALDLSQAIGFSAGENGAMNLDLDPTAAIKGAVKSGMIGKGGGFLGSPGGLAATAFVLSNYKSILGGLAGNTE